MSGGSNEFFSIVDGKKDDAHLHEPILAAGDHHTATRYGVEQARLAGLTDHQIIALYSWHDGLHKFEEGAITRDDHGKFSGGTGAVALKETKSRAFEGERVITVTELTKLQAGQLGEKIAQAYLRQEGFKNVDTANQRGNNYPVDIVHSGGLVEVKTGLVSNGDSAQQWRATIGQPGKAESEWLRTASKEDKAEHNREKAQAIIDRKMKALATFEKETGRAGSAMTLSLIINPDSKTVDVYRFGGFHSRIGWSSAQAKAGYAGSFKYK